MKANTLAELWNATVRKYPNKTFLIFKGKQLTYKEVDQPAQEFAGFLRCCAVGKGDNNYPK
jgi:acyl-CoA synthetase (AMP-forming)/AMP-acid ligase II